MFRNYSFVGAACLALAVSSSIAGPRLGCHEIEGNWSELRVGGIPNAPGNMISASDEAGTYSFEATFASVEPDATGDYDWITVYTGGSLVLNNVQGAPWYNPHQTLGSSTEIPISEVLVKSRSTRFDATEPGKLEFILFAESGWYTLAASYSGMPTSTAVPNTIDVIVSGTFTQAEVCVNAAVDVKQGSLNVKSRGVIPVVLYGSERFDVTLVDRASIRLEGAPALRSVLTDNNRDGYKDLNLKFSTQQVVSELLDVTDRSIIPLSFEATVGGDWAVFGSDDVRILNKAKPQKPAKKPKKK